MYVYMYTFLIGHCSSGLNYALGVNFKAIQQNSVEYTYLSVCVHLFCCFARIQHNIVNRELLT